MSVLIKRIDNKNKWETFVRQFSPNNFLQSWQFGQFNLARGDKPLYLGVFEGDEQIGAALFILTHARRGNYYACAAGPLVVGIGNRLSDAETNGAEQQKAEFLSSKSETNPNDQNEKFKTILDAFMQYLKEQGDAVFVRVRPALLQTKENQQLFAHLGFKPAPMHLHAEWTWVLDITSSEEELLKGMRKNTRYYVRRAPKEGVDVRMSTVVEDVKILYDLQQETVAKHGFVPFSLKYFEGLMKAFAVETHGVVETHGNASLPHQTKSGAVLFIASYQGEDIGCAMINYYGDQAVYHYAASASEFAKVPSAYLILWEAIKEAKKRECKYFNFWGVVGDEETKHPWFGLSRFKKGFGGEEVCYLHAQDYALSPRYWLTWGVEKIRKWRRGL